MGLQHCEEEMALYLSEWTSNICLLVGPVDEAWSAILPWSAIFYLWVSRSLSVGRRAGHRRSMTVTEG